MATRVTLDDGGQGILETASRFAEPGKVVVRLDAGPQVVVTQESLIAQGDGSYRLPFTTAQLEGIEANSLGADVEKTQVMGYAAGETVIPIVAEELSVGKRTVVTGGVRLTKSVSEREETVDEPLLRTDVHVERVPINQMVADAPQPRYEGDVYVVPVLEEVLIVEKRLMLKEEIRIQRTQTETHQPQQVTVRAEEVVLEEILPTEPAV